MSRRATVEPAWLDDMLRRWGLHQVREALGFPSISPMFKERIPQQARSFEPMGYCRQDFTDLEEAIDNLELRYRLVLTRAYKPWTAKAMEAELTGYFDVTERTWRRWLHEAAEQLAHAVVRNVA